MLSSFVSVLLIPKEAYQEGGPASGRAIAYLAHDMAGLLHLVPRYLPRVGLAPEWVAYARPLVLLLFGFNVVIPLIFRASVEAQGGAYTTGVLVLMLSAAVAATISLWKEHSYSLSIYCSGVVLVFGYTTLANVIERTEDIVIARFFILFIVNVSGISRYWRAKELRVGGHHFRGCRVGAALEHACG